MISLMHSLFKPGRNDSYEVTFNLPPRPSKRHHAQTIRIMTPYSTTTTLYNKIPQYKIFRSIQYTAKNELPQEVLSSTDCDRSVGTHTFDKKSATLSSLYMGQKVDELKIWLKKLVGILEYSHCVGSKQYEEVNIGDQAKQDGKEMMQKSGENKDELIFVLQQLYNNFDKYVPVFEQNSEYAKELLKLVFESKKRINKVEQDLFRYIPPDGVQIRMPINVKQADKSTADNQPDEKQLNKLKSLVSNKDNSFLQATTSSQTTSEQPGWVLLPKGYHMVKSFTEISNGFDVYLLHKDNEEAEQTDSSNTCCIKPQLNLEGNNVQECSSKTVMDVKPSIEADEVQSNFDSLNIFPEKHNIQNYNVHVASPIETERTRGILGNISIINKLIGRKRKSDAQTRILQENSDTINNEKKKTSTSVKEKKYIKANSDKGGNTSEKDKSSKKKSDHKKSHCLIF